MTKGLRIEHYNKTSKTWLVTVNGYWTLPPQAIHPYSPENKTCSAIIAREMMIAGTLAVTPERTLFALSRGARGSLR